MSNRKGEAVVAWARICFDDGRLRDRVVRHGRMDWR
jgi:hypothetical protein